MTTWVDAGRYGRLCHEVINETGSRAICLVWTRQNARRRTKDGTEPWPEGEANLALILNARVMLEALEEIHIKVERMMQGGAPVTWLAVLAAVRRDASIAIAAVKGESDEDELV